MSLQSQTPRLRIEGMDCASCGKKVDAAVRWVPTVDSVSVVPGTMTAKHHGASPLETASLGYRATEVAARAAGQTKKDQRNGAPVQKPKASEFYAYDHSHDHEGQQMKLTVTLYLMPTLIAVDLAAKATARTHLNFGDWPIPIAPFLSLRLVENPGVSFGALSSVPALVGILTASLIVGLAIWLYRTRAKRETIALAFVIAGALSNFLDRVIFGAVTDFLAWGNALSPLFTNNIADLWIGVGAIVLFGGALVDKLRSSQRAA
ncbi:MAG: signal peptidase II [Devosia sp.]